MKTSDAQRADLCYYRPPRDGGPTPDVEDLLASNEHQDVRNVRIDDIRGQEETFTLDRSGFCILKNTSEVKDFDDHDRIHEVYYPEITTLLKNEFPTATQILLHPYVMRGRPSPKPDSPAVRTTHEAGPTKSAKRPLPRVHVDWTPTSALAATASSVSKSAVVSLSTPSAPRYIGLHVWRPIKTVQRDVLAVIDGSTISPKDLEVLPRRPIDGSDRAMAFVKAPPLERRHKWYWISEQTSEELWLIKLCGSWEGRDGVVPYAPHSSFKPMGSEREGVPPRESIEVSALVVL